MYVAATMGDAAWQQLPKLKHVRLNMTQLPGTRELEVADSLQSAAVRVQQLDLYGSDFAIQRMHVRNMEQLQRFTLMFDGQAPVGQGVSVLHFVGNSYLKIVTVHRCNLQHLVMQDDPDAIDLQYNEISRESYDMYNARSVDLSYNPFFMNGNVYIHEGRFAWSDLERLCLRGCNLKSFTVDEDVDLNSLKELDLRDNPLLTDVTGLDSLPNLRVIRGAT
jgi:hypothetical protein